MDFIASQNGDTFEYWNDTIEGMFERYDIYRENLEITYLDKIYVRNNGNWIIVDMDNLNIIGDIDKFLIYDYDNDGRGIYSVTFKNCFKKTQYTKHKKIEFNLDGNKQIVICLGSDPSIVDMNNISIKVKGIDSDLIKGCIVSSDSVIKLDTLKALETVNY